MASQTAAGERARVTELIMAAWSTQVIHVAVQLGVFDRLEGGVATSSALGAETGSDPAALFRLLRAAASLGLCEHLGDDRFGPTEAGRLLCTGTPDSIRGVALHWGDRLWGALSQLDQSVRTGRPWRISGLEGFQHMANDPGQMAMFHQSMTDQTGPAARAILDVYDFSGFETLIDVGGSYGALLAAVLRAHPRMRGQVFDLPDLASASAAYLQQAGVLERARFTGGDFFTSVPPGADAYMLKMIIHDWDDEHAARILANCRAAANPKSKVLIMDRVVPERIEPVASHLGTIRADITMLTAAGGLERTQTQFSALLGEAGLSLERIVPTASGFCVLEAVPR